MQDSQSPSILTSSLVLTLLLFCTPLSALTSPNTPTACATFDLDEYAVYLAGADLLQVEEGADAPRSLEITTPRFIEEAGGSVTLPLTEVGNVMFVRLEPWQANDLADHPLVAEIRPACRAMEDYREEVIRRAYRRFSAYTRETGSEVSFELSDFHTLPLARFSEVAWLDAVTMPGGEMIDVTRHTAKLNGEVSHVEFRSAWSPDLPHWKDRPDNHLRDATVAEMLEASVVEGSRLHRAERLTLYEVRVTLDGKSRTYRAAFAWLPSRQGTGLLVLDYITQRVQHALVERAPTLEAQGHLEDLMLLSGDEVRNATAQAVMGSCTEETYNAGNYNLLLSDTKNHDQGRHEFKTAFEGICTCDTNCRSSCLPAVDPVTCQDVSGSEVTDSRCHLGIQETEAMVDFVSGATDPGSGAECQAKAACAIQECSNCTCTRLQISMTFSGMAEPDGGLSVEIEGEVVQEDPQLIWKNARGAAFHCAECTLNPEGGGGGGACASQPESFCDDACSTENGDDCPNSACANGWGTKQNCSADCDPETGVCEACDCACVCNAGGGGEIF